MSRNIFDNERVRTLKLRRGFAERCRAARVKLGWTQEEVGRVCGLSQAWICHFETGNRLPSLPKLVALADALRVSTDHLLGVSSP